MRIGYIGNIPEPVGGAEIFLKEFLKYFLQDGKTNAILARWRRQFFTYFPETIERIYALPGKVEKKKNLVIHYLFEALKRNKYERDIKHQSRVMNRYIAHVKDLTGIFSKFNVSLIHTHMLYPNLFFGYETARNLRLPSVLTIHGMLEFQILSYYKKKHFVIANHIENMIRSTNVIIAVSSEIADECKKRGAKNIIKILPGIDTDFFYPQKGIKSNDDILFIGTVRKHKGADLLIEAFCKISPFVKGNLILVGKNLLKKVKSNPRIKFMGVQNKLVVREKICRAKMVVLPSKSEGLPLSILEAMACGKPALVTRTGELQNLITNNINGFFLKDRTVDHLAGRLRYLLEHKHLDIIGKRARESVQQFNIKKNVAEHKKLYHSILKEPKSI